MLSFQSKILLKLKSFPIPYQNKLYKANKSSQTSVPIRINKGTDMI